MRMPQTHGAEKKRSTKSVDFPRHHVAITHSSFSVRKMRLALAIRRKSGKAKTETPIMFHFLHNENK